MNISSQRPQETDYGYAMRRKEHLEDQDEQDNQSINIAPSWAFCATVYMAVLQNPDASFTGIQSAKEELLRMAAIADGAVAASNAN